MKNLIIGITLITVLAFTGCAKNADNTVIVKVNDTRVTAGDVKKQIADLSPEALHMLATDEKSRNEVLDDVIAFELVLQEARRQGIENMEFIKRKEELRKDFEQRLQEESKRELVSTLIRKEFADSLNVSVTDSEVKDFYNKYRDKMVTADGRTVSLKEAAPQIKNRLVSVKQHDIYLAYAKKLREKSNIKINDAALQALASSLSQAPGQGAPPALPPVPNSTEGKGKNK